MNSSSFLLCFVFAAIGYVAHPMLLPALLDSKLVAESSLSDSYKEEQVKKTDEDIKEDTAKEDIASEPITPDVVEQPIPTIPDTTPDPFANSILEEPGVGAVVTLSDQAFIDVLKDSVRAGDVNEFHFDQVVEWKQAGEEGDYQVGMVTYKADTIFAEQQLEAKALIKNGKVVKWLWPTTNTKMR